MESPGLHTVVILELVGIIRFHGSEWVTWKFELHWMLGTFLHPMMGLKLNCLIKSTTLKCWGHNFVAFQHMKCINHPLFEDEKLETS